MKLNLSDLCADILLQPYGLDHTVLPPAVHPSPKLVSNEHFECLDCHRTMLLTIHGRCGVCNSHAVTPARGNA